MTFSSLVDLQSPVVFGGNLNTQREIQLMLARAPSMALLMLAQGLFVAWSVPPE